MFFARIMGFLILLVFLYLLWLKVVKPLLIDQGVEVDEVEPIETKHTKRLDDTKKEHGETTKSAEAIKEEFKLKKEISDAEGNIEKTEKKIKKL